MANSHRLTDGLPWVQMPAVINAPMSGAATSDLAVAVTRAGGLGQIGFLDDIYALDMQLEQAKRQLQDIKVDQLDITPVGVGVIVFGTLVASFRPLFAKYKPAVVWLSFGEAAEFKDWTVTIRKESPHTKVWVQIGSVGAALETAKACHPDALVLQGSDAGGHGHAHGASIITLLPEVTDMLQGHGLGDIPLVAAGGIMDGRSAAAALIMDASGVVMGTRFLAAEETKVPHEYREAILLASDGGASTVRSRIFDEMWSPSPWPELYDGRCLKNACYEDLESGMDINEIRTRLRLKLCKELGTQSSFKDTSSLWTGTGVGMVTKIETAADIVAQVRSDAKRRLENAMSYVVGAGN